MLLLPPDVKPTPDRRVRLRRRVDSAAAGQPVETARMEAESELTIDPPARRARRGRRATDQSKPDETPPSFARAPKPYAPLVAQLIATVLGMEQTRARRRGADADAAALYGRPIERPKRSRGDA